MLYYVLFLFNITGYSGLLFLIKFVEIFMEFSKPCVRYKLKMFLYFYSLNFCGVHVH